MIRSSPDRKRDRRARMREMRFRGDRSASADQAERRRKLGLPPEDPGAAKPSTAPVEQKKSFLPVKLVTKAERTRDCLRSLKQHQKDEDAKVKRAFQTLFTYVGNVARRSPDEENFRKIRLNNPTFQDRVGGM